MPAIQPTPEEIRKIRVSYGLTQTQAAKMVHTSLRSWQRWESVEGEIPPGYWELFTLKLRSLK